MPNKLYLCSMEKGNALEERFINKVEESGIISLDLGEYYPSGDMMLFDIKDYLFMGMILKEKDFREALKAIDWTVYAGKNVAIDCSVDAVIPMWAYMLLVSYLQPVCKEVIYGNMDVLIRTLFTKNLLKINTEDLKDKRVVIKGCGDKVIPENAFVEITRLLRPVAKSIMYGEPCSTVPIFKRK